MPFNDNKKSWIYFLKNPKQKSTPKIIQIAGAHLRELMFFFRNCDYIYYICYVCCMYVYVWFCGFLAIWMCMAFVKNHYHFKRIQQRIDESHSFIFRHFLHPTFLFLFSVVVVDFEPLLFSSRPHKCATYVQRTHIQIILLFLFSICFHSRVPSCFRWASAYSVQRTAYTLQSTQYKQFEKKMLIHIYTRRYKF